MKHTVMRYLLVIVCLCGLGVASWSIITWYLNNRGLTEEIEEIQNIVELHEVPSNDDKQLVNPPTDDEYLYWKYAHMSFLDIDLTDLKKQNPDTVGWIQVQGTYINYPFVQYSDNAYYLDHSFNKKKNRAGWVFLDYRNDFNEIGRNTIIYAHGLYNTILFGTLKNTMETGWLEDTNNHIIRVSTEFHNSLWQVFSIYRVPTTSDYIVTEFKNEKTYENFLLFVKDRSVYDFDVDVSSADKILTLSTCYSHTEKVVMHAKLIKLQNK